MHPVIPEGEGYIDSESVQETLQGSVLNEALIFTWIWVCCVQGHSCGCSFWSREPDICYNFQCHQKTACTVIMSWSDTGGTAEHLHHHLILVYLLNYTCAPYLEKHDSWKNKNQYLSAIWRRDTNKKQDSVTHLLWFHRTINKLKYNRFHIYLLLYVSWWLALITLTLMIHLHRCFHLFT